MGVCESLARRYEGRNGAEVDDLVQEGLINVWLCLDKGKTPSKEIIAGRMKNYVDWLGRQQPTDYEKMLPLTEELEA